MYKWCEIFSQQTLIFSLWSWIAILIVALLQSQSAVMQRAATSDAVLETGCSWLVRVRQARVWTGWGLAALAMGGMSGMVPWWWARPLWNPALSFPLSSVKRRFVCLLRHRRQSRRMAALQRLDAMSAGLFSKGLFISPGESFHMPTGFLNGPRGHQVLTEVASWPRCPCKPVYWKAKVQESRLQ